MKPRFARQKTLRFESLERRTLLAVDFAAGAVVGSLDFPEAVEISGLAAGSQGDVLWSHNDSGNDAQLFATDKTGGAPRIYDIPGATNVDWEDLAMGSMRLEGGSDQACIFVGDIGDNARARKEITVYRVVEPGVNDSIPLADVKPIKLTYPDDTARNAEGLMVDPESNDIYIISKTKNRKTPTEVFCASYLGGETNGGYSDLAPVTTIAGVRTIVGADLRLNAAGDVEILVMDDFAKIKLYTGETLELALDNKGVVVPHSGVADTEAIAWDNSGNYYTTSEGTDQPLYFYERTATLPSTPTLSIDDVTVTEGNNVKALFSVTLSRPLEDGEKVTVEYKILGKTATAGDDYTGVTSGTLEFTSSDDLTEQIEITILNDTVREKTETFEVVLSGSVGADLERDTGIGTIRDDDRGGRGGGKPK